ncbi:MAG: XrtA/PEP-CTERM system histidine kinase PrsK [Thermodesulfobacteriota bacterium]|nr:XrtA/PEP-CTERM system histidine kinase PrsK [Thermodesulfobacteriota bacterium]
MTDIIIFLSTAILGLVTAWIISKRGRHKTLTSLIPALVLLSLMEIFRLVALRSKEIWALSSASFFEAACVSAIIWFLVSIERSFVERQILTKGIKLGLLLICATYGTLLFINPWLFATYNLKMLPVLGILGKAQAIFILSGAIFFIWMIENILRSSTEDQKRDIKYLIMGGFVIGASFILYAIYRLTYLTGSRQVLLLCSIMSFAGVWFIMVASIRTRLLETDIFVTRYVAYHSITLMVTGAYLLGIGLVAYVVRYLGIAPSFLTIGLVVFFPLLLLALVLISPDARRRLRFFINTRFFTSKYDYRREWRRLSRYLTGAVDEREIVDVTAHIILDSMYVNELAIWFLDGSIYKCVLSYPPHIDGKTIDRSHLIIDYLASNPYFSGKVPRLVNDSLWNRIISEHSDLLDAANIELAVPMKAEGKIIGLISVGKEPKGVPYGQDDFDLLGAVATQSGSALMRARFARELAANKETAAFARMSAFFLHDLKNAAGNLSLIVQNAPRFIDEPEFRQDMISSVKESLGRIDKVMNSLQIMSEKEEVAQQQKTNANAFITALVSRLTPRLTNMHVIKRIDKNIDMITDPAMLGKIVENIIINAVEAAPGGGRIIIEAIRDAAGVIISIEDDGPGMEEEFARHRLFKPFQTTKQNGTGIGLWQVKQIVDLLGARIDVENHPGSGVKFIIGLPG